MPQLMGPLSTRRFAARRYLQQHCSGALTADETIHTRFAVRALHNLGRRFERALEFGCGPTVHHALPLVPFAARIEMADDQPANLDEIRSWLAGSPQAFDWDPWLRATLQVEADLETGADCECLEERVRRMRRAIGPLHLGDLSADPPLATVGAYDLVASYYCLERAAVDVAGWFASLSRLAALVRPGGVLLLGAMRRAQSCRVLDLDVPVVSVDEHDFARCLPWLGFPAATTLFEVAPVSELAEQGFDSVFCVLARRAK
jgi:nicotinamide N-methyltransferase